MADVLAAGGRLTVSPDRGYCQELERVVRSANRYRKTPPGTRLVHKVVYDGERWTAKRHHVVLLAEGPAGTDAPRLPVPVPDEVSRYHPAVAALWKTTRIAITAEARARARALRILHAVAVASERRGYTVTAYTPKASNRGSTMPWDLLLAVNGEIVPLGTAKKPIASSTCPPPASAPSTIATPGSSSGAITTACRTLAQQLPTILLPELHHAACAPGQRPPRRRVRDLVRAFPELLGEECQT